MLYDRKIKYLDYYENGERIRGGGFAKLEVRDGSLRIELKVTGLHPTDSFDREILLQGEKQEKALGSMAIAGGKGQYLQICRDLHDIGGTGIPYEELRGIRIPLGANREISCALQALRMAGRMDEARRTEKEMPQWTAEQKRSGQNDALRAVSRERGIEAGRAAGQSVRERVEETGIGSRREEAEESRWTKEAGGFGRKESVEESGWTKEARGFDRKESAEEKGWTEEARGFDRRKDTEEKGWTEEARGFGRKESVEERGAVPRESVEEKGWMGKMGGSVRREAAGESGRVEDTGRQELEIRGSAGWQEDSGMRGRGEDRETERGKEAGQRKAVREGKGRDGGNRETGEKPVPQKEDKWSQLWDIYPHIHPFRDQREYLSIRPSDFVLFPEASYKMVNNSFLLHGYYNYHHLLLSRVEKRGEILYYIGVPGNFYEKEKQVAIMFGFESFECAEEPAQAGDFGYYMMRTQL